MTLPVDLVRRSELSTSQIKNGVAGALGNLAEYGPIIQFETPEEDVNPPDNGLTKHGLAVVGLYDDFLRHLNVTQSTEENLPVHGNWTFVLYHDLGENMNSRTPYPPQIITRSSDISQLFLDSYCRRKEKIRELLD